MLQNIQGPINDSFKENFEKNTTLLEVQLWPKTETQKTRVLILR